MHFAKMNINEDIYQVYAGKKDIRTLLGKIFAGISANINIYDDKGGRIKFFDLDIANEGYIVTGNIGYIKKGVHSSYDPEKDTAIDTLDNNKIDYVSFYFDVDNELLGYMTLPVLSRNKVPEYFSKLIKKGSDIGVEFIQETNVGDIRTEIRKYSKISKLDVKVVPPNGDKEDFADLFSIDMDGLSESNATKVHQTFQTQRKEGINKDSRLVQNYITGAGLGYAELKFSGKDRSNNELEVSSSKTAPYTREVPANQTKNHSKISDVGKAGISVIMEYRAKLRLSLKNKDKK